MNGATALETKSYFLKDSISTKSKAETSVLGRTGWTVSSIGFGGYRIHDRNSENEKALEKALLSGCNLIDTSTNYTDGGSERLVGKVLGRLILEKKLSRSQVVVVSKAGYIQGENLKAVQEKAASGNPFPEVTQYSRDCWHAISPEFLKDQLNRSLERLGLEQLDVLLLHNPEYFLKAHGDHAEYYRRIGNAFAYLESEVKRGRIQHYGISSNTFPDPKQAPEYTSLETCFELATKLRPDHHFSVIQFPFNLLELGAVLEDNNSGKSVTELAHLHQLGTLVNRPLNAFSGQTMLRLADFPAHEGIDTQLQLNQSLEEVIGLEEEYPGPPMPVFEKNRWGQILKQNLSRLADVETWMQAYRYQIRPSLEEALEAYAQVPELDAWTEKYHGATLRLFERVGNDLESRAGRQSKKISDSLDQACPALKNSKTLSQKVVRIYRSIPGIDCILVGMRKSAYVTDLMNLQPRLTPEEAMDALEAGSAS